jgi:hypothetical protein
MRHKKASCFPVHHLAVIVYHTEKPPNDLAVFSFALAVIVCHSAVFVYRLAVVIRHSAVFPCRLAVIVRCPAIFPQRI